jgi:hypothetical protein
MSKVNLTPDEDKEKPLSTLFGVVFDVVCWMILACLTFLIIAGLVSCNTVKKTSQTHISTSDSTVITSIDTVHVVKYDTSIITKELYHTKVVEVYDTILTAHDSIITILRTRTIWSSGEKSEEKRNVHSDSSVGKVSINADKHTKEVSKETDKESSRFPIGLIFFVGIALILCGVLYWYMRRPIL